MEAVFKKLKEISQKHNTLWFRGHSSNTYRLNSGLYRTHTDLNKVRNFENEMYNSFSNLGHFFIDKYHENKEWNTVFLMQHYGLYTRLLDWTSSFMTALYFANLNRKPDETACIWVIDPIELNRSCTNLYERPGDIFYNSIGLLTLDTLPKRIKNYTDFFYEDIYIKSFAIMPRRSNDRLVSQSGYFTVQGTEGVPLEEEYARHLNQFIYRIELSPDIYEECNEYLKFNGVNYYSLFGGIDGLSKYIKDELLQIKLENK